MMGLSQPAPQTELYQPFLLVLGINSDTMLQRLLWVSIKNYEQVRPSSTLPFSLAKAIMNFRYLPSSHAIYRSVYSLYQLHSRNQIAT